jgi:hypothetical protein
MKNNLNLLSFFVLSILLGGACTKNNSTTPGGPASTNSTTITPSTATSYFGILNITSAQTVQQGTSLYPAINICSAYFSNTAVPDITPSTFVKVDSLSLNGRRFKFSGYEYQDTTYQITYPSATWHVTGLAVIPSFTYTNATPLPTFTGYATLPDTIHINQQLTVAVTGVTGSDQTNVIISDGSNASGHTVSQVLGTGATSVTFPASSLSSLTTTTTTTSNAFININCIKNNAQAVNGLPFNFQLSYQLNKTIYIKQ